VGPDCSANRVPAAASRVAGEKTGVCPDVRGFGGGQTRLGRPAAAGADEQCSRLVQRRSTTVQGNSP